jgi:hypothetical protein
MTGPTITLAAVLRDVVHGYEGPIHRSDLHSAREVTEALAAAGYVIVPAQPTLLTGRPGYGKNFDLLRWLRSKVTADTLVTVEDGKTGLR